MRSQRPARYLVVESILIALGVLAGLFAQQWQEDRRAVDAALLARDGIVSELEANMAALSASRAYHGELMGRIRSASDLDAARDFPRGFFSPARLLDAAWTTAQVTGALSHLPAKQVQAAARIYTLQERYDLQIGYAAPLIYQEMFEGGTAGVVRNAQNLGQIIGTFWYREGELSDATQSALEVLAN